jgi:hypothetical protein
MALEIPTRLGRATGISGRKTSRTVRKCIQKSDHRERRGVAFGVAGSLVCRRQEHLQLSRLDGSAFARPSARGLRRSGSQHAKDVLMKIHVSAPDLRRFVWCKH